MINVHSYFLKANNHNPWIFNGILWFISFIVLLFSFTKKVPLKIDYIYTSCFLVTVIIPCLINLYILIPKLLKHEKYNIYIVCFLINLLFFSQLNILFFDYIIDFLFPEFYFISYHSRTSLIIIFSIFIIATTLIKLSENWFYFNKNENRNLKLKNQQIENQLSTLKSQINPHFLFNSLNVIYALAIESKNETKDAIIQLSDILRYVIYDSNTKYVLLKDELLLIHNYINFQKLRQYKSTEITFKETIQNTNYKIHPMLLLPLVENSYKHGIENNLKNSFLNINILQNNGVFEFKIENSYQEYSNQEENEHSGLGLANIKENLDIIYPNKHELNITKTENTFSVSLKLITDDY
ncbi:MAG: sensor histidine kinase [Algibacter sp.]